MGAPHRCDSPRGGADHATHQAMLFCGGTHSTAHAPGASVMGVEIMSAGSDERCVWVYEHASWMRFRVEPARGNSFDAGQSAFACCGIFRFRLSVASADSGQAFPQCVFDHWENLVGNPLEEGKMQQMILAIRKRKNIKLSMPVLGDYLDKL